MSHNKSESKVAAIILAAGRGDRIGRPKLFLKIRGRYFWEWIASNLSRAGIEDMAIVIRPEHRNDFAAISIPKPIVNPRPAQGMFSSVKRGYRGLPGYAGYLICPVDHPLVATKTYRKLLLAFRKTPLAIIRPIHKGRSGHPIVIPDAIMRSLVRCRADDRLDLLLRRYRSNFRNLDVTDVNVLKNINDLQGVGDAIYSHR